MPPPCPPAQELEEYGLGRLASGRFDALEAHVGTCPRCEAALSTLRLDDPLLSALRHGRPAAVAREVGSVMERVKSLPGPGRELPSTVDGPAARTPTSSLSPVGRPAVGREDYDFLDPPGQPTALGRFQGYLVRDVLGAGGMGIVFAAEDPDLKRPLALKVMRPALAASPSAKERFLLEARAMAAASEPEHDHLVPIFQVAEWKGLPYLTMPLLRGETLQARLDRTGPLPVAEAVRIAREVADGLRAAHARQLVHRDVKPGNIWLDARRDQARLLDFGLARSTADDAPHYSREGVAAGTPAYMAPEQAAGRRREVGPAADVYGLGVVLFQMLTGRLPFPGRTSAEVIRRLQTDRVPSPRRLRPDVPKALEAVVLKAMARRPGDRFAGAAEVLSALAAVDVAAPAARPTASGPSRGAGRRFRPWVLAGFAAAVLGTVGLVRVTTNTGVLVVEADDAAVEVRIKGGQVSVVDAKSKREFTLTAGKDHDLEVRELPDGVAVATRTFRLERNGTEIVNARVELAKARPKVPIKVGFNQTGRMVVAHGSGFTLTVLPDGRVLAVGGNAAPDGFRNAAELWDPRTGTWTMTGSMRDARANHSATLLPDGRVLVAGGAALGGQLKSVEIYDVDSGTWSVHAPLAAARAGHVAVLLDNKRVLVAAGAGPGKDDTYGLASTEMYDLRSGSWSPGGSLSAGRMDAIGLRLDDGRVLIAGGIGKGVTAESLTSVEVYDPAADTWKVTGKMATGRRANFTLTALRGDGKVLAAGGGIDWTSVDTDRAEVYDPARGLWAPVAPMPTSRHGHTATLLADGTMLVAGGVSRPARDKPATYVNTALIYHPEKNTWSPATSEMRGPRGGHQAVRLPDGSVMLAGGYDGGAALQSVELFVPAK